MTARFVLSVLLLAIVVHVTTSQQLSNEDCLECWNGLCLPDGNTPSCALTDNDCIDYGAGVDREGPMLAQPGNMMLCCETAAGYVDTVNLTQLTLDTESQSSCSSSYNEQPEGNFNEDNFITLGQQRQYLFPSIQFGCKGCISNITFYTRSQDQGDSTIFNVLLWGHYRNVTENSDVFELKQNYSVNMTESLTFIGWNTDHYSTTITLGSKSVCFNPGYVFGLSVSGTREFNLQVYREKSSSMSTAVYSRIRPPCESLGTLYYPNSNHIGGNVLVAVGVREEMTTSSPAPTQSSTSFVFETNTSTADTVLPSFTSTTSSITILMSTNTPLTDALQPVTHSPSGSPAPTPAANQMNIIYIAAGSVGGILIVTLLMAIAALFVILRRQSSNKFSPKQTEMSEFPTSVSFVPQEIPPNHQYDIPDVPGFDESMQIDDYAIPTELGRVAFQNSFPSSQAHLTPILERRSRPEDHYTEMSSLGYSSSYVGDTDSTPYYQVPRNAINVYNSPREDGVWGSEYDIPTELHDHPQPPINSVSNKPHVYFDLEEMRKPKKQSNNNKRTYQVLDPMEMQAQSMGEPIYFVLEEGFYVPGTDERELLASGTGGVLSQESIMSNNTSQGTQLFENRPSFWEPDDQINRIYDQLAQSKCREIPRDFLAITSEIGSGEFGTVSKATWRLQNGIKREVAVKQLKEGASNEERAKFLQEGARMMQFFHANVVKLQGMVTIGDVAMLVVELMPNGDLKNYLKKRRNEGDPPSPSQLLRFGKDIALGMRHLTKKGFVHRDLAARNILLNESLVCKIGDFGMARAKSHAYDMTKVEQIPLRWTAPEAYGERKYTEKSDVYSYGMVLFEIWSIGRKPLPNHDNSTLMQFIKQGGVQYPPPGCPRAIYELMITCWHPYHKQRNSFSDICEYLSVPDESLLHWSSQDKNVPKQALQLGAELHFGSVLYPDLQRSYRTDDD